MKSLKVIIDQIFELNYIVEYLFFIVFQITRRMIKLDIATVQLSLWQTFTRNINIVGQDVPSVYLHCLVIAIKFTTFIN